eukprot:TRINITY_DN5546_c0_g1_i1.p1 TRINITY_DN5546_c0_g1~~TRINITY_DN5546_c0_g1_i1.p1  ORF type:complete len:161 (-),score=30.24 TRINITY_DN5546_c0_g1_i1:83-565(-)
MKNEIIIFEKDSRSRKSSLSPVRVQSINISNPKENKIHCLYSFGDISTEILSANRATVYDDKLDVIISIDLANSNFFVASLKRNFIYVKTIGAYEVKNPETNRILKKEEIKSMKIFYTKLLAERTYMIVARFEQTTFILKFNLTSKEDKLELNFLGAENI